MKTFLQISRSALLVLIVASIFIFCGPIASGQASEESSAPRVELLTINDSKPNLSATGEGITSYKIGDLYQAGSTKITLLKGEEMPFKIELPIGYSIYNNLIYSVQTDAVFSGPNDITFKLPSARTEQTFNRLRVLCARYDLAEPDVPIWIDVTVTNEGSQQAETLLSEAEIKKRLPDFGERTLHAVMFANEAVVMIVAAVDPGKVRHKMNADLILSGTATEQVTEGRIVNYKLKVFNKGPDTASAISMHATASFSFVSVKTSVGKCSMAGQNVYCKFPALEKGHMIDVAIVERCEWNRHFPNAPPGYETPTTMVRKVITVGATEQDPFWDNNELDLTTEVFPDSNKAPIIKILSPSFSQNFQGPRAEVPIRFEATDPDGFIKKIELFTHSMAPLPAKALGEPTLQSDGKYELIYKDAPFGSNWVRIVATDNLGRVETFDAPEFFVNGPARVEIINPKAGEKVKGEFAVTIRASDPSGSLKKISLDVWGSDATAIGNDEYVVKLKSCFRHCRLQAIALDESGIETRSEFVEFTVVKSPTATLRWFDGEYSREFEAEQTFRVSELILLASADHLPAVGHDAKISKLEIFANGARVCLDDSPVLGYAEECLWKPTPGKYRLQSVATDEDGGVGKSDEIQIVIERR